MRHNTIRVCLIVAVVGGAIHLSATQGHCIELLYCARTIAQMDHVTDVGMDRLESTADRYAPLIEEATLAGDEVAAARYFHPAAIELLVHLRNTQELVIDIATRPAGEKIAQPCLDDIYGAADDDLLLLEAAATFNYVRLVNAAGGVDLGLVDPFEGPKGPPNTKP